MDLWHRHPAVRSGDQLTRGERAADRLRNGMGSWTFVFVALAFLAVWMLSNRGSGFDPYPFILLNLVLSCLAALQGAILLIAAKRSDQIASELALHDYQTDCSAAERLERLAEDVAALRRDNAVLEQKLDGLGGPKVPPSPGTAALPVDGQRIYEEGGTPRTR
ncbi:DUF1003 domain-containing protein [Cryptosporangium sp. NPDC051539]|uniref:DUF1003 domain-containing protein n=1 Tax=Cryptosporangium sp. NPDC051539 TaxID=3363962 RepID=UPI0037B4BDFF